MTTVTCVRFGTASVKTYCLTLDKPFTDDLNIQTKKQCFDRYAIFSWRRRPPSSDETDAVALGAVSTCIFERAGTYAVSKLFHCVFSSFHHLPHPCRKLRPLDLGLVPRINRELFRIAARVSVQDKVF